MLIKTKPHEHRQHCIFPVSEAFRVRSHSYNANAIANFNIFNTVSVHGKNKKSIRFWIRLYNSNVNEALLDVIEFPVRYSFTIHKCVVYNIARFK